MQRVTSAAGGVDPGDGKLIYQDQIIAIGQVGTDLLAVNRTAHQEELANAVEMSGIELNPADNTQLYQAISQRPHGCVFYGGYAAITQPFNVPANVFSVHVELWGGGGGGGYGTSPGGGAGGDFVEFEAAVTPGTEYEMALGAGGLAGTSGSPNGGAGGNATFLGGTAVGGGGGGGGSGGSGGLVGTGSAGGQIIINGLPGMPGDSGGAGGAAPFGGPGGYAGQTAQYPGGGGGGGTSGTGAGGGGGACCRIRW